MPTPRQDAVLINVPSPLVGAMRNPRVDQVVAVERDRAAVSLRAKRSNPEARGRSGLLRRSAPRNDDISCIHIFREFFALDRRIKPGDDE
jgi:hypothetical protein